MIQEFNLYQKLPILSYEALDSPKVFIGCCIKSQYDEERIHIEDKFEPKRIDHCGRYLYGSLIEPFGKYEDSLKDFYKIKSIDLYSYNKTLIENNLSCEENFSYLEDGLYPLDPKYIQDFIPNFKYDSFFSEEEETPIYQRIKCVNLFLLKPNFDY